MSSEKLVIKKYMKNNQYIRQAGTKKSYTDVYIYQDQQIQEKFIELTADNFIDAKTFNKILSTFKFTK